MNILPKIISSSDRTLVAHIFTYFNALQCTHISIYIQLLMVFSFAGCALCQIVLATYMLLSSSTDVDVSAFKCIPIVSFSCCIFVAACGALPIPFVIIAEILPDKVSLSLFRIVFATKEYCLIHSVSLKCLP